MPANEFERQVQKQMEDFQLNPSSSVWKKVEEQIRKKKRRRVIVFFLLPIAMALLGYSIYYFAYDEQKRESTAHVTPSNNDQSSSNNKKTTTEVKEQPVPSNKEEKTNTEELPATVPKDKILHPSDSKTVKQIKDELQITLAKPSIGHRKNKAAVEKKDVSIIPNAVKSTNENKPDRTTSTAPDKNVKTDNDVAISTDQPATDHLSKKAAVSQTLKADDPNKLVGADNKETVIAKADSTKPNDEVKTIKEQSTAKKKSSRLRFRWGINVSGGISSNETRVFSVLKNRADALYNNSMSNNITPVAYASPFPGAARTLPPSSVQPGAAFRIGIEAEWQVSKRSRISFGLQYAYASTRIKTGTADLALRQSGATLSANNQVYRGPQTNNYTNSYHFASIPFTYHWQISKNQKRGIQWDFGITPSYMISTNALVYSSSNGGSYYHNDTAFNRFHLSLETGFSLYLTNKKGGQFVLGPEISFDTRKLTRSGIQQQQYLMYGGIGARLLFPVKKK